MNIFTRKSVLLNGIKNGTLDSLFTAYEAEKVANHCKYLQIAAGLTGTVSFCLANSKTAPEAIAGLAASAAVIIVAGRKQKAFDEVFTVATDKLYDELNPRNWKVPSPTI